MSSEAVGYAIRHSPYKGTTYTVHVMIADTVNDQYGNEFFMSLANLAKKARASRGTVSEAVGKLVAAGFLECLDPDPVTGEPIPYRFLFPEVPVVYESRGVRKSRTSRAAKVSGDRAPRDRSPDTGCAENAHGVSVDPTQTQLDSQEGTQADPNLPASGVDPEEERKRRSRELVQAHWERCKATNTPTPTLRAVKGSPFLALAGIVANLMAAGWDDGQIANALWHTSTFTTNGITFELNRRFPRGHAGGMSSAQQALAEHLRGRNTG